MLDDVENVSELLEKYPELHFKLLGVNYDNNQLIKFIRKYNITHAADFDLNEFKRFISNTFNGLGSKEPTNPITGEIFFDVMESKLKIYDGNGWQEVSHAQSLIMI